MEPEKEPLRNPRKFDLQKRTQSASQFLDVATAPSCEGTNGRGLQARRNLTGTSTGSPLNLNDGALPVDSLNCVKENC
jgi:hypothetical protein